ncbi:AAA family ATPase [Runella sp. CRIBMP]|uniref:ParA family protein n=1 Tax=Runella sp. CRIBMP TaxID=2683261 RepID=UPI0014131743|nr:ParA family protein [Runella sp. CRIBMP]NBB21902.1 AAA family ATPase [Runella sp. CRIBMP]
MLTQDIVFRFLRSKPALNHSQIEKEAGLPSKTLYKAQGGLINLNENHLSKLGPVLRNYGFSEEQFSKAKVISIVNHKGGVGKTTSTINLGKALSLLGNRVLMLDMDSQGNLSQCFGIHQPETQIIDSLLDKRELPIIEIEPKLHLSPSDIQMAYRELELVNSIGSEKRLSNKLAPILSEYDFILIDCPPALNVLTTCALVASHECLIPIQPEASAYHGVENLFNRIFEIREHLNYSLRVRGIFFTMVHKNQSVHRTMIDHICQVYGHFAIFDTLIETSTVIKQSQVAKQDLFEYSPKSNSANQYLALAKELATA